MEIKVLSFKKENVLALGEFVLLLSLALFAPYLKFQWLTGPIVNAILFVSTILLGSSSAILIGLIPSVVSLSTGLLPIVLAPMIPFIMLGNTILILTFDFLKKKNYWLAIVSSSFLKFFFLFLTSEAVINLLLKKETATKVASMMSWPQFFTALAGGAIAYLFLKSIKKK